MGSVGSTSSNTGRKEPWSYVAFAYRDNIKYATELTVNPDNGHAYFSANEAPVTPIVDDFLAGIVGTDAQIKSYLQSQYKDKRITLHRSKYI